ncbi:hypothetical protein ABIB62_003588 [Mucilaginibacter sp. UYP25]|uniref:hypothetical protein n=1 Tax=unclassified Mucilaginibacter TaxID=2617802 RepID=UPI003398B6B6
MNAREYSGISGYQHFKKMSFVFIALIVEKTALFSMQATSWVRGVSGSWVRI